MKLMIGHPFDAGIGCFETALGCFLLFLLSFTAAKIGILDIKSGRKLHAFAYRLLIPIFMIAAFQIPRSMNSTQNLSVMILIAVIATAAFAVIAHICYRTDKLSSAKTEKYGLSFSEHVAFGIPIMYAYGGRYGLFFCAAFILVSHVCETLYGDLIMKNGTAKRYNPLSVITSPITMAAVIGLLLYFLNISLPTVVTNALITTGTAASPLIIISLGVIAAQFDFSALFSSTKPIVLSVIKMVLFPLIVLAFCLVLKIDKGTSYIATTMSALPSASYTFFKSERFEGSKNYAAAVCLLTAVLYLVTLPIITYIALAALPL